MTLRARGLRRSKPYRCALAAFASLAALLVAAPVMAGPLSLALVAQDLELPTWVGAPRGDRERLFVIERGSAKIRVIRDGVLLATPFLDLSDRAFLPIIAMDERGVLAMAFHPDFAKNRQVFVHYSGMSGETVVSRFKVTAGNPDVADPASEELVFTLGQPFLNHNGGSIEFGPDGYLYLALGDGGAAGDPGNRAQSGFNLLGKILRLDVDEGGPLPYAVPASNPFRAANDPMNLILDEIWALGVRNPWRSTFDTETGDYYIADVGQGAVEEIDVQPAASTGGQNYGWRLKEGSACYDPPSACDPGGLTEPTYEYGHTLGRCAVTGGHVYRGCAIPELTGRYFFGDFCTSEIFSFVWDGASATDFIDYTSTVDPGPIRQVNALSSFGLDGEGELYLVDMGGGADGEIYKLVPGADLACQDSVVSPAKPVQITLPRNGSPVLRNVTVRVANGDREVGSPSGAEIELVASDGTCPATTVNGPPVFKSGAGSSPNLADLAGGRVGVAKVPIRIDPADPAYSSLVNRLSPARCHIMLEGVAAAVDPEPNNNSVELELSVADPSAATATSLETSVKSAKPVHLVIRPGDSQAEKLVRLPLTNADLYPQPAAPGHAIDLAASDGNCPAGTIVSLDADPNLPGNQASVTLAGGRSAQAEVVVRATSSDFSSESAKSPERCVATVTASGPAADLTPENDTTQLVIDVIDRNDF